MIKNITPKRFHFSSIEKKHLLKAWAAISVAFGIVMTPNFGSSTGFLASILISALTIGIAFLLHELAHKFVAIRYRCHAEFRSNDRMLLLMLGMSLFGIIFAAPGAVQIQGHVTRKQHGLIALAGPAMNIVLAIVLLPLLFMSQGGIVGMIARYGFMINGWLALFNMIPFMMFDGHKIYHWDQTAYFTTVAIAFILVAVGQYI